MLLPAFQIKIFRFQSHVVYALHEFHTAGETETMNIEQQAGKARTSVRVLVRHCTEHRMPHLL